MQQHLASAKREKLFSETGCDFLLGEVREILLMRETGAKNRTTLDNGPWTSTCSQASIGRWAEMFFSRNKILPVIGKRREIR